jgi:hypothetical protein
MTLGQQRIWDLCKFYLNIMSALDLLKQNQLGNSIRQKLILLGTRRDSCTSLEMMILKQA